MDTYLIIAAVIVGVGGMGLYLRDMLAGRTRPHVCSWLLWGLLGATAYMYTKGSDETLATLPYLAQAVVCPLVALYVLVRWGWSGITGFDIICLTLGSASLGLYLLTSDALMAAVMVTTTDVMAFLPTIRKTWHRPHEETLASYAGGAFIDACTIAALRHPSLTTLLYP